MSVMMALGDLKFGIATAEYQALQTSRSYRWVSKNRIGRRPARQFQGPDSVTKTLNISIYPQSASDLSLVDSWDQAARTGEPLRMVGGGSRILSGVIESAGSDFGLWCIDSITVDESAFMRDGTALEQKAVITISQYGEDRI